MPNTKEKARRIAPLPPSGYQCDPSCTSLHQEALLRSDSATGKSPTIFVAFFVELEMGIPDRAIFIADLHLDPCEPAFPGSRKGICLISFPKTSPKHYITSFLTQSKA